jgi:hypothetical protein
VLQHDARRVPGLECEGFSSVVSGLPAATQHEPRDRSRDHGRRLLPHASERHFLPAYLWL